MTFTATVTSTAVIRVAGELDASTAPVFHEKIDEVIASGADRVVIDAGELAYIASAGLRALLFARQKLAEEVPIAISGASGPVVATLRAAGLDRGFELVSG